MLIKGGVEAVHPKRRLLIQALAAGVPAALVSVHAVAQGVFGARPARLPSGQSIYRLRGAVKVNDADPESRETIHAKHHDQPVYVVTDGGAGRNIRPAPVINHSDAELELIETLVGRKPPFAIPQEGYPPRNPY